MDISFYICFLEVWFYGSLFGKLENWVLDFSEFNDLFLCSIELVRKSVSLDTSLSCGVQMSFWELSQCIIV